LKSIEIQREQARLRQLRKRQRDREARLDAQATAMAARMPEEWRADWLGRVRRNRAGKGGARAEVERTSALIPQSGRADFLARNRPNTKVSLAELRNRFVREKGKIERADQVWRAEHYQEDLRANRCHDDEIEDDIGQQWSPWGPWDERYPGSPPKKFVEWINNEPRYAGTGEQRVNTDAMARQRVARLLAAASKCHSAAITSRPEYALVSPARLVLTRLRGRFLQADPLPVSAG
jgi:hypothetical protein